MTSKVRNLNRQYPEKTISALERVASGTLLR